MANQQSDIVIIGAGHNGLVAACYLAKAGFKPLVLERRELVGGMAITEEIHPGFRCPILAHSAGPLLPHITKDLQLDKFGLEIIYPEVRVTALNLNGPSPSIYGDDARTAEKLKSISSHDARVYPEFTACFSRLGRVLAPLLTTTPPSIEKLAPGELWNLGKLGLAFRGLGKKDAYRLLRWGPMAVADLVSEWFETELLRALFAARGIFGAFAGPWSAGTSTALLWQAALNGQPGVPAAFVKGGMGTLSESLARAARSTGAEIRTTTEVVRIQVNEGKATKVLLNDGKEITPRAIVSDVDPRTTFLRLIDPVDLDPEFISKIRNYRSVGTVAKVNLALSRLPTFSGINGGANPKLSGRIHVGPDIDYLERAFDAAKYGEYLPAPYLDVTIPSLTDSSLAPQGAHVMSVHVQFAPYELRKGNWNALREPLADTVVKTLSAYAPNLKQLVLARQVITPLDLETTYGLSGGHIFHGEQSLDQFFTFRPLIGWAKYRTPIERLYLCGAGTHPGGGVTGGPGLNAAREILKDLKNGK